MGQRTKPMTVRGCGVNESTQCVHYHSESDVVAVKFKCCDTFYACIHCHQELADHPPAIWGRDEREQQAILCGRCRNTISILEYLECKNSCPRCGAAFNPRCADHYHLYFEM